MASVHLVSGFYFLERYTMLLVSWCISTFFFFFIKKISDERKWACTQLAPKNRKSLSIGVRVVHDNV